jgi:hypothetical protein
MKTALRRHRSIMAKKRLRLGWQKKFYTSSARLLDIRADVCTSNDVRRGQLELPPPVGSPLESHPNSWEPRLFIPLIVMLFIEAGDRTNLCDKDWGTGKPVIFMHGSPLISDMGIPNNLLGRLRHALHRLQQAWAWLLKPYLAWL